MSSVKQRRGGLSRRQFIGGASALALGPLSSAVELDAQTPGNGASDLGLINGRIHTMDPANRVVSQVLIRNGRFAAVGNNVVRRGGGLRVEDLRGRTVIPGIIDAHNHIVLVGNRPGWHTPLEHVLTIPDAIAVLNEGKLEDVAPHMTLVDRCATYRHLWLQQKARV